MEKKSLNRFAAFFYYAFAVAQLNFVFIMIVLLQYHNKKQNNLQLQLLAKRLEKKKKQSFWVKKGRTPEW